MMRERGGEGEKSKMTTVMMMIITMTTSINRLTNQIIDDDDQFLIDRCVCIAKRMTGWKDGRDESFKQIVCDDKWPRVSREEGEHNYGHL